jgi:predicted O-methyltransferase YrrM
VLVALSLLLLILTATGLLPFAWLLVWIIIAAPAALGLVLLAELRELRRRIEQAHGAVTSIDRRVSTLAQQARPTQQQQRRAARAKAAEQRELLANISAISTLHALFDVKGVVPPPDVFAAMPDLQVQLVRLVLSRRPSLVVECGSGTSTMWLGYAARSVGGRVVALEHHERYAAATRALVSEHGLDDVVDVRLAPLQRQQVGDGNAPWYGPSGWSDLEDIGLLLVDGPPTGVAPQARYPALPLLRTRLAPSAVVLLDDFHRVDEKAVMERWVDDVDGDETHVWSTSTLGTARGTGVLECAPVTPAS